MAVLHVSAVACNLQVCGLLEAAEMPEDLVPAAAMPGAMDEWVIGTGGFRFANETF
jgi:hypothetical protein